MKFTVTMDKKGKVKGNLHVLLKQARNSVGTKLQAELDDVTIKCSLLPSTVTQRKPGTFNDSTPVCKEEFMFDDLKLNEMASDRVLEATLWDSRNKLIGGVRLGPAPNPKRRGSKQKEWKDSIGAEVYHWESMVACPGEWREAWHTLRTSMDYMAI